VPDPSGSYYIHIGVIARLNPSEYVESSKDLITDAIPVWERCFVSYRSDPSVRERPEVEEPDIDYVADEIAVDRRSIPRTLTMPPQSLVG